MTRRTSNIALLALIALLLPGPARARPDEVRPTDTPPNILLFLVDDQGWTGTSVPMDDRIPSSASDFYQTPHLERLAREGMKFSNAYAPSPICSPTRYSIQVGKSPARLHLTDIVGRFEGPFYEGNRLLPPRPEAKIAKAEVTLAEMIKAADSRYVTAHFGKWHLRGGGPARHGYDVSDGSTGNKGGGEKGQNAKQILGLSVRARDFMSAQVEKGRPFFLQISHYAVHWPIHSLPETLEKYEKLEPGKRHRLPAYAAMTEDLDTGLGLVLDHLDRLGISDRTWVFYLSDNGGSDNPDRTTTNHPLAEGKASLWEGGIRSPMVVRGPGVKPGTRCDVPVIGFDLFPTLAILAGSRAPLPEGIEGGSLVGLLTGAGASDVTRPREGLAFHFPHYRHQSGTTPQSALRLGNYKLIKFYESGERKLFDLATDIGERTDLSSSMPAKAEELSARLENYLKAVDAQLPRVNPDHQPGEPGIPDPAGSPPAPLPDS